MSQRPPELDQLASPSAESVGRVRARLAGHEADRVLSRALLSRVSDPAPEAVARLHFRLHRQAPPRRSARWHAGLVVAAAAAAGAIVAWPSGGERTPSAPPGAPLEGDLEGAPVMAINPIPGVELNFNGKGQLAGDARDPEVRWTSGTLDVEVDPSRELRLSVTTDEARVQVLGTAFSVHRDVLGTHVSVRRGLVSVQCGEGAVQELGAGADRSCLPLTAHGLAARAGRLRQDGASPRLILETAEAGLALDDAAGVVRGELGVARIGALAGLERPRDALDAAEAWLVEGHTLRRSAVLGLAVGLASALGDCAAADRHRAALLDAGLSAPDLTPCQPAAGEP